MILFEFHFELNESMTMWLRKVNPKVIIYTIYICRSMFISFLIIFINVYTVFTFAHLLRIK